jgi:isocitrate lyase
LFFIVECRTDALINELMASSQRSSDPQKVLEEIEKERKEMEEMFTIKAGMAEKLREQEVKCKLMFLSERK